MSIVTVREFEETAACKDVGIVREIEIEQIGLIEVRGRRVVERAGAPIK